MKIYFTEIKNKLKTMFSSNTGKKKKGLPKKKEKKKDDNTEEVKEDADDEIDFFFEAFKQHEKLSEHIYFKIGTEIYLFLSVLCDKYELYNLRSLIDFKDTQSHKDSKSKQEKKKKLKKNVKTMIQQDKSTKVTNTKQINNKKGGNNQTLINKRPPTNNVKFMQELDKRELEMKKKKALDNFEYKEQSVEETNEIDRKYYKLCNYEITKIYKKLLRYCEFLVKRFDGEKDLKRLYFITHRNFYLLNESEYDDFFEHVDRKSPTTKIKGALNFIELKCLEIKYRNKFMKSDFSKFIFDVNHSVIDSINSLFSAANIGIMVYSTNNQVSTLTKIGVYLFEYFQIIFNSFFFLTLLIFKYGFFVKVNKRKMNTTKGKKFSLKDKINLYFLQSFLLNEKFSFLILNIIVCKSVLAKPETHFLFIIQLITILRNFPSTFEMAMGFKDKISQIASLFIFVVILLFFYTNLAFFNYTGEFVTNIVSTLLYIYV
jgi:hypothetical protein